MSKFFNETNKALRQTARAPLPASSEIDVQELVGALKESIDQRNHHAQPEAVLKPLLAPRGDELASQLAATRLENCRAIRLPRDNPKSLLAVQYNADLQAAVEAYRTLRTRLLKQQNMQGTRSLAVSSTAQGEGKTLTALNMALSFSHLQDRTVLLVDADLRTKGLSAMLGVQQEPGLGDILETGSPYTSAVLRTNFSNLYVLPAGTSCLPAPELFASARWKEFVAWSSETFQLVVLDAPPILDLADTELILSACESTLLVTRSGKTKREALAKSLQQIDRKKLAGVVFNECSEAAAKNYYRYSSSSGRK